MFVRGTFRLGLLTFLLAYDVCVSAADLQRYRRYPNTKLRLGYVYLETWSNSLLSCAGYCSAEPDCVSLSWQHGGQACLVSREDLTLDERVVLGSAGWITLGLVRYPVFHAYRGGMRYNMSTLAEAEAECQKRGTRLAAPTDLLDAFNLGLHLCSCGWLTDDTKVLVMQATVSTGCGSTVGLVECSLGATGGLGNAWCLQRYP